MLGIIIQARVGSTRLPNKMIKSFYHNKGVLELLLGRLKESFPETMLIVATTSNILDDQIEEICKQQGVEFYRGSETNVLQRFIDVANKYNIKKIIRVCADNPFLNIPALTHLVQESTRSNADYLSFITSDEKPSILTHFGFWAEMVTLSALNRVADSTKDKIYLEHVTNYIYSNPTIFNLEFIPISPDVERYKDIRMTLDTQADFDLLQDIYSKMPQNNIEIEDLLAFVSENKQWLDSMKKQIETNGK